MTGGDGRGTRDRLMAAPSVMVFTHRAALERNPELAGKVEDHFRRSGWEVTLGRTELERHADGVWVVGGTSYERTTVIWALAAIGISAKRDDADTQPNVQVVIGAATTATITKERITSLHAFERYHMALVSLKDHVERMVWLDKETGKHSSYFDVEHAAETIRAEIINLASEVIPVATAFDFQKSSLTAVDSKERVQQSLDTLLKKVHHHWSIQAEKVGIAPLRFKTSPIVKLIDE